MNRQMQAISNNVGTLAQDARALMAATAHVAEEKVVEARERLGIALDGGKKILGRVRDKAVEGARATGQTVHEHPYETGGIALGVGALMGFLLGRRNGEEKGDEARQRGGSALDGGKKILGRVRDKAVEGARATGQTMREHPYETVAIVLGVGVLIGFLLGRRNGNDSPR